MKIAYHAEDAVDAQLISDLLNNNGIFAQVRGAHMQGAVGEAAAIGNVKVWVNDEDVSQAEAIVEEWGSATFVEEEDAQMFDDSLNSSEDQNRVISESSFGLMKTCFFIICVIMVVAALLNV
ncbi:DUF2007 domain-containing protein [Kangiella marina]|uniref:DUF2007 domain-containing protein n=1 Tax=Kangiella marina TaxID=1079178 RepID=A0ABP8I9P4_9GAMM